MDHRPFITVVTITYNSSCYVRNAIESTLSSTYENFELLIVDDSSSDNTWEIIQEYKDPRIRAYRNEKNLGEYPNRNKAIDLAIGDYLIFIDGDDVLYSHGLFVMGKMAQAYPSCGMLMMLASRNNVIYPVVITPEQFYVGEYFGTHFSGTAFTTTLFKTSVLKELGGISLKYKAGDEYIRYKIAAVHSTVLMNDGLTWWRETPGQALEVLRNSGQMEMEAFMLKFEFLAYSNCPLPKGLIVLAKSNLFVALVRLMMRNLLGFRLSKAIGLYRKFSIPIAYFAKIFNKPYKIDPFQGFSKANPFHHNFRKYS